MASVDELAAQTQIAKSKAEETGAPAVAVGEGAGEAMSLVEAAKNSAVELGSALAAMSLEAKTSQAQNVGERLEGLAARLNGVKDGADSLSAELAGINTEFETVLSEIQGLKGD